MRQDEKRRREGETRRRDMNEEEVSLAHVSLSGSNLECLDTGVQSRPRGQKYVYHNRVTNEFIFPHVSLICTEVNTSAER